MTSVPRGTAAQRRPGLFGTPVMTALGSAFNLLALNLVLLLTALPLITLPAAVNAATIALDQWRRAGEDRVVREFLLALRASHPVRSTVRTGLPIAAAVLGVVEARYFLRSGTCWPALNSAWAWPRCSSPWPQPGTCSSSARGIRGSRPSSCGPCPPGWRCGTSWSPGRFLAEIAAAALLILADPPLLLAGVPVVLLQLMRLTAQLGLRRAGQDRE